MVAVAAGDPGAGDLVFEGGRFGLRLRWWEGGVLLLGLGGACERSPPPQPSVSEAAAPATHARAMLDQARRDLADPSVTPIRQGMHIDEFALQRALIDLQSSYGPMVAPAYEVGLAALSEGPRPVAPMFAEVAAFTLPDASAARDVEAVNWLFDRDVRHTVERVLGTYLTLLMRERGMPIREIGGWMTFLRSAEPVLYRCDEHASIGLCLDYGSDVFVFDVERRNPAWVVTRLQWMQQPLTVSPHLE